jgi:methionyl-tRNA formyltransferase
MKILILGHYEIACNYAISLIVNELLEHDLNIMLSGQGDAFEEEGNGFSKLACYEQQLCDELNQGIDSLKLGCDSFDALANKINQAITLLTNPNNKQGLEVIANADPDLIISIRYRKIFKQQAIAIPGFGIINLHSGLLPEYRGAMATFWAMLNGDKNIGSTLHYITDGTIDTGRIIAKSAIECDYQESYLTNVLKLYQPGCTNIIEAVKHIESVGSTPVLPLQATGTYYSFPNAENLARFKHLAYELY